MKTIRTLAAIAALAAFATPAHATGEELYDLVDALTMQTLATVDTVAAVPWQAVPRPPLPVTKTFEHNTDYIVITDQGSGPYVSKVGAFNDPRYWNCSLSNAPGAPVAVHCLAVPWQQSGVIWKCDVMDVTATALSSPRDIHQWTERSALQTVADAQATVDELVGTSRRALPSAPDPRTLRWGQVAGRLGCNNTSIETDTASQAFTSRTATGVFNMTGVTEFVCEARRARGDARSPITSYTVNCLDPGAPGVQ